MTRADYMTVLEWAAVAALLGAVAVCALILIRHIPNIRRLKEGREPLFDRGGP